MESAGGAALAMGLFYGEWLLGILFFGLAVLAHRRTQTPLTLFLLLFTGLHLLRLANGLVMQLWASGQVQAGRHQDPEFFRVLNLWGTTSTVLGTLLGWGVVAFGLSLALRRPPEASR